MNDLFILNGMDAKDEKKKQSILDENKRKWMRIFI